MKGHAHGMLAQAAWVGGCLATVPWAAPSIVTVIGGAAVSVGTGIAPDLDTKGTAARCLGMTTRLLSWLICRTTAHREHTHTLLAGFLVSFAVAVTTVVRFPITFPTRWAFNAADDYTVTAPWVAFTVLVLTLAFCEASMAADDPKHRRIGVLARWAVAVGGATVLLVLDPTLRWLPVAVLVGWWSHLLGDCMTTQPFRAFAPFSDRLVGGWRWIKPVPKVDAKGRRRSGRRQVSARERAIDYALWVSCGAGYVTLWGWWPTIIGVLTHPTRGGA